MKIDSIYRLIDGKPIVTDSRKVTRGCVFVALKGDNFNGNKFAADAIKSGADIAIIDQAEFHLSDAFILVDNCLSCLQNLATFHREKLNIPIIAIVGSNGKTTTKELVSAVLSKSYHITNTKGNLNNHIGVPLTLLSMTNKTQIGVVEMGANHPNEIAELCQIAHPNYGYITNFGKAHLEGFGSLKGVIKAKSELYQYLYKNEQQVFVNLQDKNQVKQTEKLNKIEFNNGEISLVNSNPFVSLSYKNEIINSQLTGAYNYNNMAAAIAIGQYFKVSIHSIKAALENYKPNNNRSEIINKSQVQIIMDAYNANPTSMLAALDNFNQLNQHPKFAILGDMFELGKTSNIEHQAIADKIAALKIDKVYLIGSNFYQTKIVPSHIVKYKTYKLFKAAFKPPKSGVLLIKASRGMALERVLDLIN